jgi:hypothetical protein
MNTENITDNIVSGIAFAIAAGIAFFPIVLMMAMVFTFPWYDQTAEFIELCLILIETPWFVILIKKDII